MAADLERRATFARIGGHSVLDLINTVGWRLSDERRYDDLHDFDDLVRWARQAELLTSTDGTAVGAAAAASPAAAVAEFDRVRQLREAVYDTLFDDGDPHAVGAEYRDALAHAELTAHGDHWGWNLPADIALPRRRIALSAMELLTSAPLHLLAQCQDAECGWVFLDTSARKNRRWCVSADCGNRNRVRRYYAKGRRSRAASSAVDTLD